MTCTSICEFGTLLCFCSKHMSRSKFFFLSLLCDHVTPTQRSETSSRSQGGGSVMASTAAAQGARKSQLQSHCSL